MKTVNQLMDEIQKKYFDRKIREAEVILKGGSAVSVLLKEQK